jgi:hypothetical protein
MILLLASCASEPRDPALATLAELVELGVVNLEVTKAGLAVIEGPNEWRTLGRSPCIALDDSFRGTINGKSLEAGFMQPGFDHDYCHRPTLKLGGYIQGAATVEVADDTYTMTAEYPAEAFTSREITLWSTLDWSFTSGQRVTVKWSHPDDPTDKTSAAFIQGDFPNETTVPLDHRFDGDTFSFTIPDSLTGDGVLQLWAGPTSGEATTCVGATKCLYSSYRMALHPAHISR